MQYTRRTADASCFSGVSADPSCKDAKMSSNQTFKNWIVNTRKSLISINKLLISKEGDQSDYLFEFSLKAFVHWCIGISMDNNRTVEWFENVINLFSYWRDGYEITTA